MGDNVLTVGMAVYEEFDSVYFTLIGLRANHGFGFDIVVVDNGPRPDPRMEHLVAAVGGRYVYRPDLHGTSKPRDACFWFARTPWVMVIDSHVLFPTGAVAAAINYCAANPKSLDIVSGPVVGDDYRWVSTHWQQTTPPGLWGTWAADPAFQQAWGSGGPAGRARVADLPPFDIPMMGLGCFMMRRAAWPGFHPLARGFGGEEGYVHEVVRRNGGKAVCLPALTWFHKFRNVVSFDHNPPAPYPAFVEDHVWNLIVHHRALGVAGAEDVIRKDFAGPLPATTWSGMIAQAAVSQPFGRLWPRPERQKLLGVWYTNNTAPDPLLADSLGSIRRAVDQTNRHDVTVSTCVWEPVPGNPFPEARAAYREGPAHLNIARQIKQAAAAAGGADRYDAVVFLEHDVLYPPGYFDRVGDAFARRPESPVVSNLDYIGLNATGWLGVRERHEPLHQLSMRAAAFGPNMDRAEAEALRDGVCLLEPQGDRKDWVRLPPEDKTPAVHVNHTGRGGPGRLTSHGEVVFNANSGGRVAHPYWGDYRRHWPYPLPAGGAVAGIPGGFQDAAAAAPPACGSCGGNAAPPPPPKFDSLADWAAAAAKEPSDFNEHVATLRGLADGAKAVAEISAWDMKPALLALAASTAEAVTSYATRPKVLWSHIEAIHPGRVTGVVAGPNGVVTIASPVDVLFIDTLHQAPRVHAELTANHSLVRRHIVVHCTDVWGEVGDDGGPGVMPAVRRFLLDNREWTAVRRDRNNYGLIVLSKDDADKRRPPGIVTKAMNFARAKARHLAAGAPVVTDRVFELRMAECAVCPHRYADTCGACGCPIEDKASWATETCGAVRIGEEPRWKATADPADIERPGAA